MSRIKSNIPGSAMCHCGSIKKGFKPDGRWICADCYRPLWMTIDTAPKDDTEVLVLCKDGGIVIGCFAGGMWWIEQTRYEERKPIYWMPIPEAPRYE